MIEITTKYLEKIKDAIELKDSKEIDKLIKGNHPADIAQIIFHLNRNDAFQLFSHLNKEERVDVLVELEEDNQQEILKHFEATEIVQDHIREMDSDDAADIINELPDNLKEDVLDILHKSNIKDDQNLIHLIEYHEDSAGGLMAKELLKIPYEETVSQCISVIQKNTEEVENIYAVYVVDENEKLKGIIPLQTLVLSQPNKSVKEIFKKEVISVKLDTPAEDVANKMQRYDLVVLPVVDENNVLVGRITIDDVLDFVKEEAEEDYQLMSGITEDVDIKDKVWVLSRSRLPWLILGLIGGIFASLVIGNYEDQIKIAPEMAFFIPLITAMAGNAGIQSSAIVVQALASNTFEQGGFLSKILKEISVAMINGLVCAALLLTYGFIFEDSLNIAYTISLSLFAVIIIASALGITIPFILDKLKIDPALATGPFITTSNDLIGLAVYFWLGHLMYSVTF